MHTKEEKMEAFGFTFAQYPVIESEKDRVNPLFKVNNGKTDALVETTITWAFPGKHVTTTGIDPDQIVAAIFATEKMLNLLLPGNPAESAAGTL